MTLNIKTLTTPSKKAEIIRARPKYFLSQEVRLKQKKKKYKLSVPEWEKTHHVNNMHEKLVRLYAYGKR